MNYKNSLRGQINITNLQTDSVLASTETELKSKCRVFDEFDALSDIDTASSE